MPAANRAHSLALSIIMPVYNEAATVQEVVARVLGEAHEKELVIVDDGSTDGTRELLAEIKAAHGDSIQLVLHEHNRGKGAAVRTGIECARNDIIIIQDADLEYDPEDYGKLLEPFADESCEVVYGSRFLSGDSEFMLLSRIANRVLTLLTNLLYRTRLTDMETCYKAVRAERMKGLDLRSEDFTIEPEITAKLLKQGATIHEVPVHYSARHWTAGKKIGWKDGVRAVCSLIRYRFRD